MRYRPFSNSGTAVSAVSLILSDQDRARSTQEWVSLIYAALENGVNCFEVAGRHPALLDAVGHALKAVERRLIFVAWRIGRSAMAPETADEAFSAKGMQLTMQSAITRTGLGYLDLAVLDDPTGEDLSTSDLAALKGMRSDGLTRMLGIAGESDAIDVYLATGAFDALETAFNLASGWRTRNRLKDASHRDMAVIGYGHMPQLHRAASTGEASRRLLWPRRGPAPGGPAADPYAFLHQAAGWTADEICLAFALTEPAVASVQITPTSTAYIAACAAVADREMPAGLAAQIEMARIMADEGRRRA